MLLETSELKKVISCLRHGGVIAYPTEAVYGLGCDPFNKDAVAKILQIKKRSVEKGLIVVASDWEQIKSWVEPIPPRTLLQVLASWPGPYTWVFPASTLTPTWIRGRHPSIALRVSAHPTIQALCRAYGPLVSTSANCEGEPPLRDARTLKMMFGKQVDFIVPGKVGGALNPTPIRDAISGQVLR